MKEETKQGRNCHYDTLNISVVICKTDTAQRLTVSHDGDRKTPSICNSDVLIYAMLSTNYIVVLVFLGLNLDDNHAVPMFLNVLSFNKVLVKHLRIVNHYPLNF